jgi:RHS repeat-associated protein
MGAIWVIFIVFSSLLAGGNAWSQSSLAISYSILSMSCGTSQNLSASGGCPPYNWTLSGGGTLTPSGDGNSSATYTAPTSNANCANNPVIILTDYCGNTACIKLAVNCYTGGNAFEYWTTKPYHCCCYRIQNPNCAGMVYNRYYSGYRQQIWNCNGTETVNHFWGTETCGPCPYPPCTNFCACNEVDEPGCWMSNCAGWEGSCDVMIDLRTQAMKAQGCCPLNPETGSPYDEGSLSCQYIESQGKNGGKPPCQNSSGDPVNVATGDNFDEGLDLTISTPGIPLEFRRSYNNQITFNGPLGYGWTHTYNVSLGVVQTSPTARVRIWDSDGRALYFSQAQQTSTEILFGGESGVKDRLKQVISTGQYILRRKQNNLTYIFSSDGKLQTISDPNGNTLALTYTGRLLTQVANNFGKSLLISYNNNHISSITDPSGRSILYQYTNGDLTKVIYPDTNSINYAYTNHNLTDKYDTNNNLIGHWGYDNSHRVITYYSHLEGGVPQERIDLTYQLGSTSVTRSTGATTFTTAVIDSINVVQQSNGCSTCGSVNKSFQYSSRLDLTQVTSIDGANQYTTQYTYDNPPNPWEQVGEVVQRTEALGWPEQRTTSYTYTHRTDDPFLLTQSTETKKSVANPQQNKVIIFTYDNYGNIASRQESGYVFINGVATPKTYTTTYQYNTLGQLTQIDGPRTDVSDITTYQYYPNTSDQGNNQGQLMAIVNALGQSTQFSNYDANGNLGTITDPNGVVTIRMYDERNRIKTITNQSTGAQTQYFYDSHGNQSSIIFPEGNQVSSTYNLASKLIAIQDTLGNKIVYQYDVEGNRIHEEIQDPHGVLKKYLDFTYDAYNDLKRIVNPDSTYTEYTYDGRKNRTASQDPNNNITLYTYDALSRIKQMTQPSSTVTNYGYDTQDNQASITDPKGNTTQYQYDDFGRRMKTISPDTGTTTYVYDEAGNLIQKTDAKGTMVNYTYDVLNRVTFVQFSDPSQNIAYTYDSTSVTYGIGRFTGRTDSSGSYTFYYDAQGNMIKEEKTISNVLYTTQYVYDLENTLTSITYPSGRTVTYTLDQVGRITQVSTTLNGNPKTLASGVSYLPYGGITGLTYGNGLSLSHGYDNQYRTSSIIVGSVMSRTYEYDPNGNITSILDAIEPSANEVFEDAGMYTYQQATNKLTQVTGELNVIYGYDANGNITSANNRNFIYDLSNRLIRVKDNGVTLGEYVYNASNQRIKKIVQGATRIFHYDLAGHLIAETNGAGQALAEYIYIGDQPIVMIRAGELAYYYHNDHLGTPQILTDESQNVSWKAFYTPFGEAVISVETVENPFRFPGQYYDQETGLHYNYHRYYDPMIGRFVTPDPIGLRGGINLFVWVQNNPINKIDPNGLEVQICARQSWPEIIGGKDSKFYVVPHCYVVVNGVSYSWHTESTGGITHDEDPSKNSCSTMKCCPEKQAEFDQCVKQAAEADIGHEGNMFFPAIHDCCTWSNGIIGKCWNKICACCKK